MVFYDVFANISVIFLVTIERDYEYETFNDCNAFTDE